MKKLQALCTDMPADVVIISAALIKAGDRVRFRNPSADYTVEEVEIDNTHISHIRHRFNDGLSTCGYHPAERLWITDRELQSPKMKGEQP